MTSNNSEKYVIRCYIDLGVLNQGDKLFQNYNLSLLVGRRIADFVDVSLYNMCCLMLKRQIKNGNQK